MIPCLHPFSTPKAALIAEGILSELIELLVCQFIVSLYPLYARCVIPRLYRLCLYRQRTITVHGFLLAR